GRFAARSQMTLMRSSGGSGYGVPVRTGCAIIVPAASRTEALMPPPPQSTDSVIGLPITSKRIAGPRSSGATTRRYSWPVRIRIDLSYDGTEFSGWAKQPERRTVQGELEAACDRILRLTEPARLTVAGRTDAGVHARAQVAHLDLPATAWDAVPGRSDLAPEIALTRRLNAILPRDIAIIATTSAPEGFDARFSALWREYSYRLTFDRDPLDRHFALTHDPVDL